MATSEDRQEGVKGAVEELKGRTKEAAGTLFGHDSTQREGRAQQAKAHAQRQVAEREEEADRARERANFEAARERSEQ